MKTCFKKLGSLSLFILLWSGATSQNSQTPLDSALIACYNFSGNANDNSGNGNNGVVNGANLTSDRFGNASSAYAFNGSNNIVVPNFNGNVNGTGFSISFWATAVTPATRSAFLMSPDDPYNRINIHVYYVGSTYWDFGNIFSSGRLLVSSGNPPAANTWDHWVFTMSTLNGGMMRIYRNGAPFGTVQNGFSAYNAGPTKSMLIGGGTGTGNSNLWFMGTLDDVRIYRRSLTQTDVTTLYNTTSLCMQCATPAPAVNTTPPANLSICQGQSTTLTAVSANGINWYAQGNMMMSIASGTQLSTAPLSSGVYTYYAVASNTCQTAPAAAVVVTVQPAVTMNIQGGQTSCQGTSASFTASLSQGSGTFSWYDDPAFSNQVGTGNVFSTPAVMLPGTYNYYVTNNAPCVVNSPSVVVFTVRPNPVPLVSAQHSTICAGESTGLTASGSSSYVWSNGQNTPIITVSPAATTVYTVTGNNAGCQASTTIAIVVSPCTGLEENSGNPGFGIYPNPAQNELYLSGQLRGKQLTLNDLQGRIVMQQQISENESKVNIEQVPQGVYVLRLLEEGGAVFVNKLLIQRAE